MTITSAHDTSAAAAQPTSHSGERLVRRAMLDTYLKPIYSHLAGDVTEVAINKPGEIWTEGPTGWIRHAAPELTYQSNLMTADTFAYVEVLGTTALIYWACSIVFDTIGRRLEKILVIHHR